MKLKIARIFKLLEKREKKQLIIVLAGILIMGFIELIGVGSIGPFISVVSNPGMIHSQPYLKAAYNLFEFSSDTEFIVALGVGVIAVIILSNISLGFINFIIYVYSGKRRHTIAMRLLEKYLRQPYIFFLNTNTAVLSRNILSDVATFVSYVLINLLQLLSSSVIVLLIIIMLIILNPVLALTLSMVLGTAYIVIFYSVRKFLNKKGKERSVFNTLKYKYINETFGGIKDIKILGKEKVFLDSFSGPSRKSAMNDAISELVNDIPKYLIETIAIGGMIGLVLIMMLQAGGRVEEFLPILTVYAFGAYRMLPLLQKIFRAVTNIRYHFPIIENLTADYLDLPWGEALGDDNTERMDFNEAIRLENIVFSYPNTDKEVIKGQNLTIASNTSIAFVGHTGCGKTTMVDIILGLLVPLKGRILVDGSELTNGNRKSWQKNLGYVPQSIYLIDDTIKNNIAFGIAADKIDDNAVITAAKLANIHEFVVSELPKGYDTVIGERGIRLSGGQRQRIGIARAVYHDPSVLILDEATSALDGLTEGAIMEAIKTMEHKKTIVMIAHRITTVRSCDVIYLMEKGVIVDHGSYDELYAKNEKFRRMADGV
jgi:ABC-type multidrug transport system fused ATPase/permease subunit